MITDDIDFLRTLDRELTDGAESLAEQAAVIHRTMRDPAHREFVRSVFRFCERTREIAAFSQASHEVMLDEIHSQDV